MATTLSGFPLISAADVLANDTTQQMPLGVYMETKDGRGFRYCKVGATSTVAGKVYQAPAQDTTNQALSGGHSVAAAAIGATSVVTTNTITLAKDLMAGGYMSVVITPGQGYTYRIKGNTAATAAVTTITLEDPLVVALTTSSKVIFMKHPYDGVVVDPGTLTGVCVGVSTGIITNAKFGWLQTHGPCAVLFTGTGVVGKAVGSLVSGTEGSSAPAIAATNILGYHMATGINTEYAMIYLTLN